MWYAPELRIIATDSDTHLLERARRGLYRTSSIKDMPDELIEAAFDKRKTGYQLNQAFKEGVTFLEQDIRMQMPEGSFYLILCRNLVFTYFEESLQNEILEKVERRLAPGGYLVIGAHETLPRDARTSLKLVHEPSIYRVQASI
jgi:chemotaxis protein methyltransferase CheR